MIKTGYAKSYRELIVYQRSRQLAQEIFCLSQSFPREEMYSLTDQIRRASRSVCTNIGEAYRKRRYSAHFVSKLTDAGAEATETMIWLDFSLSCGYLDTKDHTELSVEYDQIGKMLGSMISAPEKFCYRDRKSVS